MGLLELAIFMLVFRSVIAGANGTSSVARAFLDNQLVPDVLFCAPTELVQVVYNDNTSACLGNYLPVPRVALQPRSVCWQAESNQIYTLAMVDPDAISRTYPVFREVKHWLVVNIPGGQFRRGTVLASYLSPTPPPGTGAHRYVFLVYCQTGRIEFNTTVTTSEANRTNFSIRKFAADYNMTLCAGNFYFAELSSLSLSIK